MADRDQTTQTPPQGVQQEAGATQTPQQQLQPLPPVPHLARDSPRSQGTMEDLAARLTPAHWWGKVLVSALCVMSRHG
eukprot:1671390-Rhodomonas_salina.1